MDNMSKIQNGERSKLVFITIQIFIMLQEVIQDLGMVEIQMVV